MVMGVSARWRKFYLQLEPRMEGFFWIAPKAPTSLLKELSLNLMEWSDERKAGIVKHFATSYPALRALKWEKACESPPDFSKIGFRSLTSLCIGEIDLTSFYEVLSQLTGMKELTLRRVETSATTVRQVLEGEIKLPRLATLHVGVYKDVTPIFEVLSLPNLSSLYLKSGMGLSVQIDAGWEALNRVVQRSQCRIVSFAVGDAQLSQKKFGNLLYQASLTSVVNLRHLAIISRFESEAIEAFTGHGCNLTFPLLQSMQLCHFKASDESLRGLIASRPSSLVFRRLTSAGLYDDLKA